MLALGVAASAQTPANGPAAGAAGKDTRPVIVVDAAHGGQDPGATLNDHALEKDVTLAMSLRLRSLLTARDFNVVLTRDQDSGNPVNGMAILTDDQRAGIANHAHGIACLLIHATSSGRGVHLYTSGLAIADGSMSADAGPVRGIVWDKAQTSSLPQSQRLASELGQAMKRAHLPVVIGQASVRPIDNLTCPAVAIEIAPLAGSDDGSAPVTDGTYEQRVVESIAGVMLFWRSHVEEMRAAAAAAAKQAAAQVNPAPAPAPAANGVPQ